jgi:hypothetical protein
MKNLQILSILLNINYIYYNQKWAGQILLH